jgi:osmotically-inducible protein OsmY
MKISPKNSLLLMMCLPFVLNGCALGAAAGLGASAGVAAAQEGGLSRAAKDTRIQAEINRLWFEYNVDMFTKLDLTVNQGRVLITGIVQNPEDRVEAVRLAWKPKGVKQVINEIRVSKGEGFTGYARDTWISTRLRTALTLERNVQSINYTIDTVQGTVYLMGFAQSQRELNRVLEIARTVPDVKQVVSYVKLVGDQKQDNGVSAEPNSSYQTNYSATVPLDNGSMPRSDMQTDSNAPVELVPQPVESQQLGAPPSSSPAPQPQSPQNYNQGSYGGGY